VRTEGGSVRLEGEGVEVVESGEGMVDAMVGTGRIRDDEEDEDEEDDDDDDDEESDDEEEDDDDDDDDDERRLGGWMDVTFKSKEGSILFYVG
jgi:ABC-type Zn2+ transport system substrate-binding protein/surface adhesin